MNEEQLQAIEERANVATPGLWFYRSQCIYGGMVLACVIPIRDNADADAAFIAHARADVPALIAEVRRLRAKLDAVPVDAMGTVMEVADIPFGYLAERNTIGAWLNEAGWKA